MVTGTSPESQKVLVLAADGHDSTRTSAILTEAGVEAEVATSIQAIEDAIRSTSVGAVLLVAEALAQAAYPSIAEALAAQPAWSDLPVILFARPDHAGESLDMMLSQLGGNITVLERPVRGSTVISAVRAALRARRRQIQLRELLQRLEEADRRKNEFLAMLGHELRNPLAAIHNALQVMQHTGGEVQKRQPLIIERQSRHLARIVDDLLDVTRVTMGRVRIERECVDLCELVARSAAAFEAAAAAEGHRLMARTTTCPILVEGDAVRLEQVMSNLVSNAIKYTPRGGHIEIHLEQQGSEAVLSVRDDGIGIPAAVLPQIFELFAQEMPALDRSRGGLGLGLSLVRSLVELHGGSVEARSEGRDRGSTFLVRLPLLAGDAVARSSTPPGLVPASALRILVVEDNDDARETMKTLLEVWGHAVWSASDGRAGLELALSLAPDVALVDIGLPNLDGYEVARQIRSQSSSARPLLIAMTGYGQPEDRARALDAGFDTHMVKPVQAHELARILALRDPRGSRR